MNRRGAAAALAAALLLTACASTPRAPQGVEPPLAGRLAIKVESEPARHLSAGFELDGDALRGRLVLTSPLGTTLGEATWSPGHALLRSGGEQRDYANLDDLAEQALGERIPLAALFHWLRGRPWPDAPSQPLPAGDAGFTQAGWRISLARRGEGWVEARRDAAPDLPGVTVRARLDAPL